MLLIGAIMTTVLALVLYAGISMAQGFHSGRSDPGEFNYAHVVAFLAVAMWVLWWFFGGQPVTW